MIKRVLSIILLTGVLIMGSSCGRNRDEGRIDGSIQTAMPSVGDTIAIIRTVKGDITVRLFPEFAPLAVENFVTHARNGFYDGLIFHRVMDEFMIQTGCHLGNGTGGESIWGHGFAHEVVPELNHLRGALSMANPGTPNSNGSQFFIVQNSRLDGDLRNEFSRSLADENHRTTINAPTAVQSYNLRDRYPVEHIEFYLEHGGTPWLDSPGINSGFVHTVFGMVIAGMDVVDAIAAVPTHPGNHPDPLMRNRPIEDVPLITIEITEFTQ